MSNDNLVPAGTSTQESNEPSYTARNLVKIAEAHSNFQAALATITQRSSEININDRIIASYLAPYFRGVLRSLEHALLGVDEETQMRLANPSSVNVLCIYITRLNDICFPAEETPEVSRPDPVTSYLCDRASQYDCGF